MTTSPLPERAGNWNSALFLALMWLCTAAYLVLVGAESVVGHRTFRSTFDVAIYDQRLWLLAEGRNPFSTIIGKPLLGDHFEPALVALTPLYWMGLDMPGALVMQTIGIALVAPATYALARATGAPRAISFIPAVLWLISPATASANLFGFRPAFMAPLMLVVSVWALHQRRHGLLAVSTAAALSVKEDMAVTYLVLALLAVTEGRKRVGAMLATVSIASLILSSLVIRALSGQYEWQLRRFAGARGGSYGEVVGYLIAHPLETVETALRNGGLVSVVLVAATGGLCLLAARWMLLALPTLLFNALSAYRLQHDLAHHYHLVAAAGFFTAAALGVRRLPDLSRGSQVALTGAVISALAIAGVAGYSAHLESPRLTAVERRSLQQALDRIPSDAAVAATPDTLAHLSHRVDLYTFPEPFVRIDWGSSLSAAEYASRARKTQFAVVGLDQPVEYLGDVHVVRDMLVSDGWTIRDRVGGVEILERS